MKKLLLISAMGMTSMSTFQASALSFSGDSKKAKEFAQDVTEGTKSAKAAAGKTKNAVGEVVSTTTKVAQDVKKAGESFQSALGKFMAFPVIQEHETMITCGVAGSTTGFMGRYLRSKTRFSKEANLNSLRKLLYRTKGAGIGAKVALLAGLFFLEPQVQSKTALKRSSKEKSNDTYAAAGIGFIAGAIL